MIADLLGKQNFSTKESAILELVKNAYDAGAKELNIVFENSSNGVNLTISDDGVGMDEADILKHWMRVGNSSRGYKDEKTDRVYAGSKGIGRFALARLGKKIEMITKKADKEGVFLQTDWEETHYREDSSILNTGTTFRIYYLNDRWNRRMLSNLSEYISRMYNDDTMKIKLQFDTEKKDIESLWDSAKLGENYVVSIDFDYNAKKQQLVYSIHSDEFEERVHAIPSLNDVSTVYEADSINVFDDLRSGVVKLLVEDDSFENSDSLASTNLDDLVRETLQDVGDFKGRLFFRLAQRISDEDKEKFDYKHKVLTNKFKPGVVLYRNAFSIDSYEGRRDWLNLQGRTSKSPAAASHPHGRWRVRANQLSGYILIDKQENKHIEDLSNRQGIVEDDYFKSFKLIIELGIDRLEFFRQNIIRKIADFKGGILQSEAKQNENSVLANKLVQQVRKDPEKIKNFTTDDVTTIINEFARKDAEIKYIKQDKENIEHQFRYETQLLNVLATSQLRISSLAHELNNNRNSIQKTPELLEERIKDYLDWEELESEDGIRETKKIPYLMTVLNSNNEKILRLTDTILEEIEKKNFEVNQVDLEDLFNELLDKWKAQYNWINFEKRVPDNASIKISNDYFMVIFDNLILNSIQCNDTSSLLTITINATLKDNFLIIEYSDDGNGLAPKYRNNPMKILEAHETSKVKGHGLGMWMVNNTIQKLNGKVLAIESQNGFKFSFNIEGLNTDERSR